jgi:hypothetical protein
MQHVSQAVNLQGQQQGVQSSTKTLKSLQPELVVKVFAAMKGFYTHLFVSAFPTREERLSAMGIWADSLSGLSVEQIDYGLSNLPEKMPNPAEFKAICLKQNGSWEHNTQAYKVIPKSRRIEQKADKEKARSAISNINQILGRATA